MNWRHQLLILAEAYRAATGVSEARLATVILDRSIFFTRLREGKGCNVDTHIRVRRWFHEHWPAELPWPEGVAPWGAATGEDPSVLTETQSSEAA